MSIIGKCLFFRGSVIERRTIQRGFHYKEVSVTERRPLLGSVYSRECPLLRSVHYTEVSIIKRCPLLRGVRYLEVSIQESIRY